MDIVAPSPTSLYRYYDESDLLIYVGITSRGMQRNREHNSTKTWWRFVVRQEVEHFDTRAEALRREAELVSSFAPPFNKQHNPNHEQARTTYLLFAAARSQPSEWSDEVRHSGMRIDLDFHGRADSGRLVLRSRIEDMSIAHAIKPSSEMPRVVGLRKVGRVTAVEKVGPFALFVLSSTNDHPVVDAVAYLKFDSARQRHLEVKHITARLDHSDPSLCNKRCPAASHRKATA